MKVDVLCLYCNHDFTSYLYSNDASHLKCPSCSSKHKDLKVKKPTECKDCGEAVKGEYKHTGRCETCWKDALGQTY